MQPLSMYPLKPEEALTAFMKIDKKKLLMAEKKAKKIVSFVFEDDFNEQKIKNVTSILKEFGIKTNQESVAFVIDGEMYYINL